MKQLVYDPKTKMLRFCSISRNHFGNKCLKLKNGKTEPLFELSARSQKNIDADCRECDVDCLTMKGSRKVDQSIIELIIKAQAHQDAYIKASNGGWFHLK